MITFLASARIITASTGEDSGTHVPDFVTDITQSKILDFKFTTQTSEVLCTTKVIIHPEHLDVMFFNSVPNVKDFQEQILTQLRTLINETRPDLHETPIKDIIYRS